MSDEKPVMEFVSRHPPTDRQVQLAGKAGYVLVHVGDDDGFNAPLRAGCAVAVVHPASAIRYFADGRTVGIFQNANRAPEGAPPSFVAAALHIYSIPPWTHPDGHVCHVVS